MSTTRPRLKLDEQSFQGLLAAAFTIQEHNDKRRTVAGESESVPALRTLLESLCPHCATPLPEKETRCPQCGLDQFRPGERMQHKYASLWEMSREHGVRHDTDNPPESALELPQAVDPAQLDSSQGDEIRILDVQEESPSERTDWLSRFPELAYLQEARAADAAVEDSQVETVPRNAFDRFWHRWQTLNLPRADLYLGIAILIAALAIVWPAPVLPQRPRLQPWQRILVKMGIAEAPPAAVHYRGDPNVQVWVDPHTALYYCPGNEQYGKTANGYFAEQREAQLEQFEPAARAVCQ